jgi:predicted CoA-binding protein
MAEKPEEANVAILNSYRVVQWWGCPRSRRPSYQVPTCKITVIASFREPGCREIRGGYPSPGHPFPVEVVDIFRKVEAIPAIVAEAIEIGAKAVWMHCLRSPAARARSRPAVTELQMKVTMQPGGV